MRTSILNLQSINRNQELFILALRTLSSSTLLLLFKDKVSWEKASAFMLAVIFLNDLEVVLLQN